MSERISARRQTAQVPISTLEQAHLLQRKCACGGSPGLTGECDRCREKRLTGDRSLRLSGTHDEPLQIQTKLAVNQLGDRYEQEADRIAEHILRMPAARSGEQSGLARHTESPQIQRACSSCAEQALRWSAQEEAEKIQAKELPGHTPEVTPEFEADMASLHGGGQQLPLAVRTFFEPRFGYDFSQVRIHTSVQATELARAIHARAFTAGKEIFFG